MLIKLPICERKEQSWYHKEEKHEKHWKSFRMPTIPCLAVTNRGSVVRFASLSMPGDPDLPTHVKYRARGTLRQRRGADVFAEWNE